MQTVAAPPTVTSLLPSRQEVADGTMAFRFDKLLGVVKAGQFLDMTLLNPAVTDAGGNTRSFSIASGRAGALTALSRLAIGWPYGCAGRGPRLRSSARWRDPAGRVGILACAGLFQRTGRVAGLGLRAALPFLKVRQVVASKGRAVLQANLEFVFPGHPQLRATPMTAMGLMGFRQSCRTTVSSELLTLSPSV